VVAAFGLTALLAVSEAAYGVMRIVGAVVLVGFGIQALRQARRTKEVGYYGLYVWFVGRMRAVLSRAGVRRGLEQVSGGVLLLLGVRLALES